ncbi:MAG TPA: hypothetical protein VNZ45_11830, partial [Bacteroidia bacterium]|nr:hypothetical protein [Bacteroidia bacterium]
MKKLSVITASLVLFAGISFAQQSGSMPAPAKASGKKSTGTGSASATTTPAAPVKKVPNSKTTKPAPTATQP